MDEGHLKKHQRSKRSLSLLEKSLILLFVALTGTCIGLVVVYITEMNNASGGGAEEGMGCGKQQQLTGSSGEFTSENYPSSYDNGKSCSWHITVDTDKVIHLAFPDFSLEDTSMCSADFVTLKDNLGIIGKYCGYSKPKPVVSMGNSLTVYFDTNDKRTDKGFKAVYKAVAPESVTEIVGAGGLLQGDSGELLTPSSPAQQYENGALYQWKIVVTAGEKVRLTFTAFDLVPESCGDYVDVYDGHADGAARLGHFCGTEIPKAMVSSGNTMVIRFKSDASQTAKGFRAVYQVASQPPIILTTTPVPDTTISVKPTTAAPGDSGCGSPGSLSGRKGMIQSQGFPEAYPGNLWCKWDITVAEGYLVKLHITELAMVGEAGQCGGDKLIVSDGLQSLSTQCGFILPPVLVSINNKMSLSFQSDSRLADRGFSAKWEAVFPEDIAEFQGCGGASSEETGVIKSKNWPKYYTPNSNCLWTIQVPNGKTITLTFTHFDMEAATLFGKCYDSLVIYDGAQPGAKKYGPFCGSKLPSVIKSRGNQLVMRLHSDFFTEGTGFRAYWTTDASLPVPTEPPALPNPWDDIKIDWPETCGKPKIPPMVSTRIVNGEPAKAHSWPWQVSMQVWPASYPDATFLHTCGGTLIHKHWVLTAAHCFINYADELQRWRMCLGKHNLTYVEPGETCYSVQGIYRHEGFKYPNIPLEFDIALVRLDGEVTPSDHIDFACLPSPDEVLPRDKQCYASGWGDETGSMNPVRAEALNQVALPVIPFDTCKRMDYWWFQMRPSMICTGYTKPDELKSVCQGDSGGPLVCQDDATAPWEVHGVTSFGPIGCIMDKKPSVFTRSSAYLPWIDGIIRKEIYDKTTSGCGGPKDVAGTSGTLSSMEFPRSYSNGARCQWNVRVSPGKHVHLSFSNFSLEESQLCLNDKVTLADQFSPLGTHCSGYLPGDLVTAGDTLTVTFTSNNRVVDQGFHASWKAVDPADVGGLVGCGGSYSDQQGELVSPNWPNDYPALAVCSWRISIPSAKNVYLTFTHFEVQPVNILGQCVDFVEVFDGAGKSQGQFCGFVPPHMISVAGDTAVIRFLSNTASHEKGFRGYWTTDPAVFPTLPPPPPNPWDNIIIDWPTECGTPAVTPNTNASVTRVVNGEEATPHSWPWQVSMQGRTSGPFQHVCGGSLIHEQWVLTAAHCFLQLKEPSGWQMCLGKHHLNATLDGPAEVCVAVDAILSHKGFASDILSMDLTNDIALVRLATPVNMTREISPVCMPKPGVVPPAGKLCYVTGWGDEKGNLVPVRAEQLNQAALPIVPYSTCSKPQYWWDVMRPSMICAGYESPDELKSACQGDSGGPFVCTAADSKAPWEVHGVVSFGVRGCIMDKKPSVFTRVSAFTDWIEDQVKRYLHGSPAYI